MRLEKRDPSRNMQRYYAVEISQTLFGEWMIATTWGRIGRPGQMKLRTSATRSEADALASMKLKQKKRRGYAPTA